MPPRLATRLAIPPRFTPQPCIPRALHATPRQCADFASKNHYERLNICHDASPSEIKKSFYSLSKSHHPDVNRSDPHAAQTFSLLSESYTVLSDPSRRAQYDRDTLRREPPRHGTSYHGSGPGPPGGRSPSGLSRRRGSFRGPPPSFYRNGGWDAQGEKRRKAHEESSSSTQSQSQSESQSESESRYGGMGPGSNPFGATDRRHDSVPHFDRRGHTRTHRREDERRRWRRRRAMGDDDVEFEPQTSLGGHFLIVAGILGATFVAPLVYLQVSRLGRQERDKG
ncbi:hypothetical protein EsDP_00002265 [Epichloe bromicola]|uniref:J domain-containing protein n=1 Tax=Epichloe bromicola TaxID=79588 RepID=A0ABQ0CKC8_9HYPO